MSTARTRQTRSWLSRTPARWALCCVTLLSATAAYGYATDTSWVFRFETDLQGFGTTSHGTVVDVSLEPNPKFSRSGKCMKAEYCLGLDQGCGIGEYNYWASWNTYFSYTITRDYNTFCMWVKRDKGDLQERDFQYFFRMSDKTFDLCSTAPIVLTAADTAGRFIKIPLVSFRVAFDPKDSTRTIPPGATWQQCLTIGARNVVVKDGVTQPKVSGAGTLWIDDIGLFYDPASPAYPGPYVPYDASVSVRQEAAPALRPVLSREAGWTVAPFVGQARELGRPVFDLTGRRAVTSARVGETGVYVIPNGGLPGPGDRTTGSSAAAH